MSSSVKKVVLTLVLAGVAVLVGSSFSAQGMKNTFSALASAVWGS